MSALLELVREDLRGFGGYSSARSSSGMVAADIWLNANESAWANPADGGGDAGDGMAGGGSAGVDASCRRYPDPQPAALSAALASLYGCDASELLIGRGSDEAIDLLVRALCVPGRDAVVIAPPVFGMYAVSARLQGARLVEVPLLDDGASFAPDFDGIVRAVRARGAKLVFLCSPGNPTGAAIPLREIARLAAHLGTGTLVVVDEAYGEYAGGDSALSLRASHPNIAVLRTLSKAHALAAARIGCVVADAGLIAVLRACQAPYPVPTPCAALALAALAPDALAQTRAQVATTIAERLRVAIGLASLEGVRTVYRSDANFLLARFADAGAAHARLLAAGIVVRDQRAAPQLHDALRITIGSPLQNDRVLQVVGDRDAAAPVQVPEGALR